MRTIPAGVLGYLRAMSKMCNSRVGNFETFVLKHGMEFKPAPLPDLIERGKMKECFRNAALATFSNPSLTYCEGFALSIIPVLHAWCLTPEWKVAEVTWREPGIEYFGIPFKTDYVRRTIVERKRYGVIDNLEMRFPLLQGKHPINSWLKKK